MRILIATAAAALIATGAQAQVLGGGLGGSVGGTVGGVGGTLGTTAGATVDTGRTVDAATDTVDHTTNSVANGATVRVTAGSSTRISRGTRCYYQDDYYDPIYRDGYYYCEQRGTNVSSRSSVGVNAGH